MDTIMYRDFVGLYASTLGRSLGIRVRFGGSMAFWDGDGMICLPELPTGTVLTRKQYLRMGGFLDHETAHVRYTPGKDTEEMKEFVKRCYFERMVYNIVEDARIEMLYMEEFPGASVFLRASANAALQESEEAFKNALAKEKEEKKEEEVDEKCLYRARILFGISEAFRSDMAQWEDKEWLKNLGLENVREYIRGNVLSLREWKDTERVSEEIIKMLQDAGVEWDKTQKSFEEFLVEMLGEGVGGELGEEGDKEKEGMGALELGVGDKERIKEFLRSITGDLKEEFKGVLRDVVKKNGYGSMEKGETVLPPVTRRLDRIFPKKIGDEEEGEFDKEPVLRGDVRRLAEIFYRRFLSREYSYVQRGLEEGTLDEQSLHKLSLGVDRVYKQKRGRVGLNTALCLALDFSGSMNLQKVLQAARVLVHALDVVKRVKVQVFGFTTGDGWFHGPEDSESGKYKVEEYSRRQGFGRTSPLFFPIMKDYRESHKSILDRLYIRYKQGYTPLGEAYAVGFESLMMRKEEKRVFWVLTDGSPCLDLADSRHSEELLMSNVYMKFKRNGIETLGIALNCDGDHLKGRVDYLIKDVDQENLAQKFLEGGDRHIL